MPLTPYFVFIKTRQRILAQSLVQEFGSKGVHFAYYTINAYINTPWTSTVILHHKNKLEQKFVQPEDIADEIYYISQQKRFAWSFDVELRADFEN